MQWDVDWKIRGKTLSKQFWIFYAVSIFRLPCPFPRYSYTVATESKVSRSRSFLLFHEGRQHVLENDEFTKRKEKKSNRTTRRGWMFNGEKCTASQCQTLYYYCVRYHRFFCSCPPLYRSWKNKNTVLDHNIPISKLTTIHVPYPSQSSFLIA